MDAVGHRLVGLLVAVALVGGGSIVVSARDRPARQTTTEEPSVNELIREIQSRRVERRGVRGCPVTGHCLYHPLEKDCEQMLAVRTPLAGIAIAFALLLVETLVGGELVTEERTLRAMQQRHEIEEMIAAIKDGRGESIRCDETEGMALGYRVHMAMHPGCLDNLLGKDCWQVLALRTPIVGFCFAVAMLIVEVSGGGALATHAETRSSMRDEQLVDELRAAIQQCERTCDCRVTHVRHRRRCL